MTRLNETSRSVSENPVVGPRASGLVTGKDGEAGDIGDYRRYSRTQSSRKTSRSKPDRILRQAPRWILAGLGLLLLLCGSIRLQKLDEVRARTKASKFDAADYARDFWDTRLPKVLDQSPEAQSLVSLFNTDMDAAIQRGQTLGESRVHAYLVQGMGTIVDVDQKGIALKLADTDTGATVRISTGLFISGNAIRDGSGLVDVSAFSDTMKFNKISAQINNIVVAEVIKPFLTQSPKAGQRVRFFGAAEVAEDATEKTPFGRKDKDGNDHLLSIVPIRLAID